MSTIAVWLSKAWLVLAVAAVGGFLPFPAQATTQSTPKIALDSTPAPSGERLQNASQREQRIYAKLGRFFARADSRLAKAQELIDTAKSKGKDVASLQAALAAFSAAVKDARPVYDGGTAIIAAHKGFNSSGSVVDAGQAFQAVLDIRTKLKDVRDILAGPAKALRDAVHAFRQANQPAAARLPRLQERNSSLTQAVRRQKGAAWPKA